jgi:hypothetical protein
VPTLKAFYLVHNSWITIHIALNHLHNCITTYFIWNAHGTQSYHQANGQHLLLKNCITSKIYFCTLPLFVLNSAITSMLCHVLVASLIYYSNKLAPLTIFGVASKQIFPGLACLACLTFSNFNLFSMLRSYIFSSIYIWYNSYAFPSSAAEYYESI